MAAAQQGDTVKVHYTGKVKDGEIFDSTDDREPLEFTLGEGLTITGFEEAIVGMEPGDSKTVDIPVNKAYGEPREDLVIDVAREQIPPEIEPEEGLQLQLNQPEGDELIVVVTDVNEETVTLDGNHPLAGKDLNFNIELVEIG